MPPKKLGLHVLAEVRDLGIEYLTNGIVSRRGFVDRNEKTVRGVMRSTHGFKIGHDPTKDFSG